MSLEDRGSERRLPAVQVFDELVDRADCRRGPPMRTGVSDVVGSRNFAELCTCPIQHQSESRLERWPLPTTFGGVPPSASRPIRIGLASVTQAIDALVQGDLEWSEQQNEDASLQMISITVEPILPCLVVGGQRPGGFRPMGSDHPIVAGLDLRNVTHGVKPVGPA